MPSPTSSGAPNLFIRTVGLARATTKIGLANLVYNVKRLITIRRFEPA